MARNNPGRIRIIGGRCRGRRIAFPEAAGLRPTPDRVRETLFNWLAPYLEGARVLDLFAGSGALGLEALSRGASSVVAVDNQRAVTEHLRETCRLLQVPGMEVVDGDGPAFLRTARARPFDLVFLDPPHADADYGRICGALHDSGLLRPAALVYLEFPTRRTPEIAVPESWQGHRSAKAGDLTFQLWRATYGEPGIDPLPGSL